MVERTLDHRLGAKLAIAFQQVALQAAGIDADAHRAPVILGYLDDLAHARGRSDIAGVQAGGAALRRQLWLTGKVNYAADVERYPRMKPSISSDPQAIAWSMLSPCCVQRAIILVIVACEYICVAMLVGAGAQAIEATRSSRGG